METELVHIGFGNVVAANRILAIVSPGSAPVKRMVQQSKAEGKCVDATRGRKPKSVVVMDQGHILLAAISPETIAGRLAAARVDRTGAYDTEGEV